MHAASSKPSASSPARSTVVFASRPEECACCRHEVAQAVNDMSGPCWLWVVHQCVHRVVGEQLDGGHADRLSSAELVAPPVPDVDDVDRCDIKRIARQLVE